MKTTSSFLAVSSLALICTLTSCGTSAPESTAAPDSSTRSTTSASAETAEGDVTDPTLARKKTHLTKAAAKIQNGVTTRRDVIGKLGLFYKKGTNAAGQATAVWTYKLSQNTAKAFIPGSAFIPGAVITYYQSVSLVLDANDVVISHSFLETTQEKTGLGFSYGS